MVYNTIISIQCVTDGEYGVHLASKARLDPSISAPSSPNNAIAVMACPASCIITSETAIRTINSGQAASEEGKQRGIERLRGLRERQLIASYVVLHLAYDNTDSSEMPKK